MATASLNLSIDAAPRPNCRSSELLGYREYLDKARDRRSIVVRPKTLLANGEPDPPATEIDGSVFGSKGPNGDSRR